MKELLNGCKRTEIYTSPKDYKNIKSEKDLKKNWFVECVFYDPTCPKPFPYRKRMNSYKTLEMRKIAMDQAKKLMEKTLDIDNYNPIKRVFMRGHSGLTPKTFFADALTLALGKLKTYPKGKAKEKKPNEYSYHYVKQIRCAVTRISEKLIHLGYEFTPISEVETFHVNNILENLDLPDYTFNKFIGYASKIFKIIKSAGCIKTNPCNDIDRKEHAHPERETLNDRKLHYVFYYLQDNHYEFFRFCKIFFLSGARESELMRVQKKDVDINNQEYKVTILKGGPPRIVTKVIIPEAIASWEEVLELCTSEDEFLFSKGLVPGDIPINPTQLSRRWKRHVKNSIEIKDQYGEVITVTEDLYSLKHLFLDKIDEAQMNAQLNIVKDTGVNLAVIV
ncbi:site-specific integrase [Elizabethkingia anophelis]|uniref:hypothetical protein n=1 Tax=Elizabethkingia anophelis TaxID=1117645 RepID=UPI001627919A|nr:hypothetical protein [Elizabethkingia anophelis]MCT4324233.1 hypothetical protein [Elizabethkingia anophelis]